MAPAEDATTQDSPPPAHREEEDARAPPATPSPAKSPEPQPEHNKQRASSSSSSKHPPTYSTIMIGTSPYTFEIPPIDSPSYSDDAVFSPAINTHVPEASQPHTVSRREESSANPQTRQGARRAHFEEAYRQGQQDKLNKCDVRGSAYRQLAAGSAQLGGPASQQGPAAPLNVQKTAAVKSDSMIKFELESQPMLASTYVDAQRVAMYPSRPEAELQSVFLSTPNRDEDDSLSSIMEDDKLTVTDEVSVQMEAVRQRSAAKASGRASITEMSSPEPALLSSSARSPRPESIRSSGSRLRNAVSIRSPSPTTVERQSPMTGSTVACTAPKRTVSFDLDRLHALRKDFYDRYGFKDVAVSHEALKAFQIGVLEEVDKVGATLMFVVSRRLNKSSAEAGKGYRDTELDVRLGQAAQGMMTQAQFQKLTGGLPAIANVLAERGLSWWHQSQVDLFTKGGSPLQTIDTFIKELKVGATGGREPVGKAVRQITDVPIAIYGTGPLDPSYKARYRADSMKWSVRADCVLPVYVRCLCIEDRGSVQCDADEVRELLDLVDEMLSDQRTHMCRCNYEMTMRYQKFIPVVGRTDYATLKPSGWNEMKFNKDTCKIRWKTIQGGLILSYMDGYAECPTNKVMCLTFDAERHKEWIPFLSGTRRLFANEQLGLVFGYEVALPWPMSKRELSVFGMATDSLHVPGLEAVQMWCFNNPVAATSLLGVPVPALSPKAVDMEIPALAFALSPVGQRTRVQLCAVFDVKVSFLPMAVQNQLAKLMATKMFGNVQNIAKDFDRSKYREVYERNQAMFDDLLSGRGWAG